MLSFEAPKDAIPAEAVIARGRREEAGIASCRCPNRALPRGGVVYMHRPLDRPEELPGATYKIKWLDSDHAFYITINDIEKDGRRRPFEVFINSKNMEAYAWALALTRMISAVFRRGGEVGFVVEELKAVFDPRGGQWMGGRYAALPAGRDRRSDRTPHGRDRLSEPAHPNPCPARPSGRTSHAIPTEGARARFCPRCGDASFVALEGCDPCLSWLARSVAY